MKRIAAFTLAAVVSTVGAAWAQSQDSKGHNMKGTGDQDKGTPVQGGSHQASGTVKKLDVAKGTVTLAHGPVKSLGWPAMTMGFVVEDRRLFDKLAADKKVDFEFVQQGANYVVTSVK